MSRTQFQFGRASAAVVLAIGSAGAAAFGPEAVKSAVPATGQGWWFTGLFVLATVLVGYALWQRRRLAQIDNVGIVVGALDHMDDGRGMALWEHARRYAADHFVTSVAPFPERLPADASAAAAQIDAIGGRINELIGFVETLAPSASQINLVPVLRNAAAFRVGLRLGKQHRKPVVLHQSGAGGTFPAVHLANLDGAEPDGLEVLCTSVPTGTTERGCLLLSLQGSGPATLDRVLASCAAAGVSQVVELRSNHDTLPNTQKAFEGVVQAAVRAWNAHRPLAAVAPVVVVQGPSSIALALGAQLAQHPDGPWTPWDHIGGSYRPA